MIDIPKKHKTGKLSITIEKKLNLFTNQSFKVSILAETGLNESTKWANPDFFIVVDRNIGMAVTKNKTIDKSVAFLLDDIQEENANDSNEKLITNGNPIRYK